MHQSPRPHHRTRLGVPRPTRRPARSLVVLALLALGAVVVPGAPGATAEASAAPGGVDAGAEARFVGLVNNLRTSRGLEPLTVDPELTANARNWSVNMANAGGIYHTADQSIGVTRPWEKLGENVGTGPEVVEVFNAFVASPTHYANLTDPDFDHIGIGVIWQGPRLWTTQRFRDGDEVTSPVEAVPATPAAPTPPASTPAASTPAPPAQATPTSASPAEAAEPSTATEAASATTGRDDPPTEAGNPTSTGSGAEPATSPARTESPTAGPADDGARTAPAPDAELVQATAEAVVGLTG